MSDVTRELKRQAADFEEAASREQGTLRAYWRGFAAGLRTAAQRVSSHDVFEDIATKLVDVAEKAKKVE